MQSVYSPAPTDWVCQWNITISLILTPWPFTRINIVRIQLGLDLRPQYLKNQLQNAKQNFLDANGLLHTDAIMSAIQKRLVYISSVRTLDTVYRTNSDDRDGWWEREKVRVCVWERDQGRERERERELDWVRVCVRKSNNERERERESESVCMRKRPREREREKERNWLCKCVRA